MVNEKEKKLQIKLNHIISYKKSIAYIFDGTVKTSQDPNISCISSIAVYACEIQTSLLIC